MRITFVFLLSFIFLIIGCGKDETPHTSTTPDKVQPIENSKAETDSKPQESEEENSESPEKEGEIYGGLGLYWLADHQNEDGSWSAKGFHSECGKAKQPQQICLGFNKYTSELRLKRDGKCTNKDGSDDSGEYFSDELTTAFALLAFLSAGFDSENSFYSSVKKGIDWLISRQQKTGRFALITDEFFMMTNAVCTIALSENYSLTEDES